MSGDPVGDFAQRGGGDGDQATGGGLLQNPGMCNRVGIASTCAAARLDLCGDPRAGKAGAPAPGE